MEGPPPNGDIAELRTTSDGESKAMFLAFDELVLRKLDELLGEVGDAKERLRLISKAIEHLREMREKLSQAEWVHFVALIADGDTSALPVSRARLILENLKDQLYTKTWKGTEHAI